MNLAQRNVALDRDMMKKGMSLSISQEGKISLFTFSQVLVLIYTVIFPTFPEVFPDRYQEKPLFSYSNIIYRDRNDYFNAIAF